MILIDYNGLAIASMFSSLKTIETVDENIFRHIILSSLLRIKNKFSNKYGEMVIASDSGNTWRKDFYPYYKAGRKKFREQSTLDWTEIYRCLNLIFDELDQNFKYKCIKVPKTEADDILAVLSKNVLEKHVIVSNDKDMTQLKYLDHVDVYAPIKDIFMKTDNPQKDLFEHICRGDPGDGIPNVLSDDDTFVVSEKRQVTLRSTKIEDWYHNREPLPEKYQRNKTLISFHEIPDDISSEIIKEYNKKCTENNPKNLMAYFREKKLTNLFEKMHEF